MFVKHEVARTKRDVSPSAIEHGGAHLIAEGGEKERGQLNEQRSVRTKGLFNGPLPPLSLFRNIDSAKWSKRDREREREGMARALCVQRWTRVREEYHFCVVLNRFVLGPKLILVRGLVGLQHSRNKRQPHHKQVLFSGKVQIL